MMPYAGTSTFAAWEVVESLWTSKELDLNRLKVAGRYLQEALFGPGVATDGRTSSSGLPERG